MILACGETHDDFLIRTDAAVYDGGSTMHVAAFGGNGNEFARWTLYRKLAPAFRSMMINTENSPLMDAFRAFDSKQRPTSPADSATSPKN